MMAPDQLLDHFLGEGRFLHIAANGQMTMPAETPRGLLLLPGSFNPLHGGHWKLAEIAAQIVGQSSEFELSVVNVDKPMLSRVEIRSRLAAFAGKAPVWLTQSARFLDKAECFPETTFIVGADTVMRLVATRYYGDTAQMHSALNRIRTLGCRFLVACRVDDRSQCVRRRDLPIPPEFADLFTEIPPEQFRFDISSTQLRGSRDLV
jgi:nicotinic acid mononucleotide adenylyltransferase